MNPKAIVRTLCIAVVAAWTPWTVAATPEDVVDLPTRGVTQRFLYLRPAAPLANVVLFAGGNGQLQLEPNGTGGTFLLETNVLTRNRQRYAAQGFAVAVVDAPSDRQDQAGLSGYRQSGMHFADISAVIQYMRGRADVPVWLIGHSNGAESALYISRELPADFPVGTVLVAGSAGTLINMGLRQFARPVQIVSHEQDPCSALSDQTKVFSDLLSAPIREHAVLTGGTPGSAGVQCVSGYHQFEGLDAEVTGTIAGFVKRYNGLLAPQATTVAAVEYYHAGLDHYFLTWVDAEIAKLDAGTEIQGWVRTGQSFNVWRSAQGATSPVCRFYIPPGLGDSHFYGRGTAECDATAAANPTFVLEDPQFMHVALPVAGACPAGTVPVYRVFSNRADANHRYMTDRGLRDGMVAAGWLAEGDGPDLVVMCAAP